MDRFEEVRQRLNELRQALDRGDVSESAFETARERLLSSFSPNERAELDRLIARTPRSSSSIPRPAPSGPPSRTDTPIPRPTPTGSSPSYAQFDYPEDATINVPAESFRPGEGPTAELSTANLSKLTAGRPPTPRPEAAPASASPPPPAAPPPAAAPPAKSAPPPSQPTPSKDPNSELPPKEPAKPATSAPAAQKPAPPAPKVEAKPEAAKKPDAKSAEPAKKPDAKPAEPAKKADAKTAEPAKKADAKSAEPAKKAEKPAESPKKPAAKPAAKKSTKSARADDSSEVDVAPAAPLLPPALQILVALVFLVLVVVLIWAFLGSSKKSERLTRTPTPRATTTPEASPTPPTPREVDSSGGVAGTVALVVGSPSPGTDDSSATPEGGVESGSETPVESAALTPGPGEVPLDVSGVGPTALEQAPENPPAEVPSDTPVAEVPTETATIPLPTATVPPPTETATIPAPTETAIPTETPVPPTETPIDTATETPTETPVPPTETPSDTPTPEPPTPTPEPGTEEFVEQTAGHWVPLVTGDTLPGWQTKGQVGWRIEGDALILEKGQGNLILVTEKSYRDLAVGARIKPRTPETGFGMLIRAQGGGKAVRVEFRAGKGTFKAGDQSAPVEFDWAPDTEHHLALWARGKDVALYIDRRKVASLTGIAIETGGRLGVYCLSGTMEVREAQVQVFE